MLDSKSLKFFVAKKFLSRQPERVLAIAASLLMLLTVADFDPQMTLDWVIVSLFICAALWADKDGARERYVALVGLGVALVSTALVRLVENDLAMGATTVGLVSPFLLAALVFRDRAPTAAHVSLSVALIFTLFIWLALTFELPFWGESVSFIRGATMALLSLAVALRFSGIGWLKTLKSKSRHGAKIRAQCIAAIIGPWAFGLILYRVFGVMERQVAIEQLMIGAVIVCLLVAIYITSQRSEIEENRRISDLKRLKTKAETDSLTGLANRECVSATLNATWSHFKTTGVNSAVILFDLDHFKSINDTFGHCGGDLVLKSVREAVAPVMRSGDTIGRWGGEEFLCILPGAQTHQLQLIAERLRAAIEALSAPVSKALGAPCVISASFGVAQFHLMDETANGAIIRADKALYQAKSSGRNKVAIGGSLNLLPPLETRSALKV